MKDLIKLILSKYFDSDSVYKVLILLSKFSKMNYKNKDYMEARQYMYLVYTRIKSNIIVTESKDDMFKEISHCANEILNER